MLNSTCRHSSQPPQGITDRVHGGGPRLAPLFPLLAAYKGSHRGVIAAKVRLGCHHHNLYRYSHITAQTNQQQLSTQLNSTQLNFFIALNNRHHHHNSLVFFNF